MIRLLGSWTIVALALSAALMPAGCPVDNHETGEATPEANENVYAVLSETVAAQRLDAVALPDAGEDTPPASASGDEIPFESIPVEVEDIFTEAETLDGALPIVHGGVTGRFIYDQPDGSSDDAPGVFRGRWFGMDGEVRGRVHGRYSPLTPEELPDGIVGGGVFQGRYTDNQDRFMGFLRGRYGHRENAPGRFFGRWLDRELRLVGVLKGHWTDESNTGGGAFRGRWAGFNICAEADSMPASDHESPESASAAILDDLPLAPNLTQLERMIEPAAVAEQEIVEDAEMLAPDGIPCIDPNRPFGFLHGHHHLTPSEDPNNPGPREGVFIGHWLSGLGHAYGRLHGRYIEQPEGSPDGPHLLGHFHGRYLDRDSNVRGTLHGVYGISEHGLGVFRGRYFDLDENPLGILRGRWTNNPNRPGGPFAGIWIGLDFEQLPGPPPDGD